MGLELPSQRDCLEHLTPRAFGILKQSKVVTSGWASINILPQRTVCEGYHTDDDRKGTLKTLFKISIHVSAYLHQ